MTRSPRPSKVLYRVGQVIRHKRLNIRGVIIGWDENAKAPIDWIERNYSEEEVILLHIIYRNKLNYSQKKLQFTLRSVAQNN